MSYLRYLCLFACNGVQHILCCVFVLFFFVLVPVSRNCPFLIVPSVFSNIYLIFASLLSLINFKLIDSYCSELPTNDNIYLF
jgi:hypothetical protein